MKQHRFKSIARNRFLQFCLFCITACSFVYAQEIRKGPYLIEPDDDAILIRWETDGPSSYRVKYGIYRTLKMEAKAVLRGKNESGYLYEAHIERLKPGLMHYYQVTSDGFETPMKQFKTYAKDQANIRFVAMGDSRSNPEIFKKVVNDVHSENPDVIISMGDLVENGGNYNQWGEYYFSVAQDLIDHIPLVSTLGDHEGDGDDGELFRHFLRTDQSTEKQWFSFDYGAAHFISLDYRHPDSEEMIKWFINDISSSNASWNFVYMHRPSYNMGAHRSTWGRANWPELFRKYKVDIVFAGHSHIYERFYPLRPMNDPTSWPVTYITTGGAGAGLYEVAQNPYLAKAESVNHHLFIEISGDTLRASAFRNDNSLLDEFSIIKRDDYFDEQFLALVKPQEDLDISTMFGAAISFSIAMLPLEEHPVLEMIELSSPVEYEIAYTIRLAENSAKYYRMDDISGVLGGYEKNQTPLKFYSKTGLTISSGGDIEPELRFEVVFKNQSREQTARGGKVDYWPGD